MISVMLTFYVWFLSMELPILNKQRCHGEEQFNLLFLCYLISKPMKYSMLKRSYYPNLAMPFTPPSFAM